MSLKIRVAITVDPEISVPPILYGGIERMVDMLVRGLTSRGHHVTLFANPDSSVPCNLKPYPGLKSQARSDLIRNMTHVSSSIVKGEYDLIHSFARLAYLLPVLPMKIPKLMSYQRSISRDSIKWGDRLSRGTLNYSACSSHLISQFAGSSNWHVVYNGAPMDKYDFRGQVTNNAPLLFLGRVEEIKGAHLAIEVANKTGRQLIIAGNVPEESKHQQYFEEAISPHLGTDKVQYVGAVNDEEKNRLLGQSAALLMPICWDEPFGIVMAEALACGTPVIGLNRGSVPEVVEHGVNGFVCESVSEIVSAVNVVQTIKRANCRRSMEEKFSDFSMVTGYERLYAQLIAESRTN